MKSRIPAPRSIILSLTSLILAVSGFAQTVSSITPSAGLPGTSITISGSGFGATQDISSVTFNGGAAAPVANWSDSSIVLNVPQTLSVGQYSVQVTVANQVSNALTFTVTSAAACPCSIWSPGSIPVIADGGPDSPVELGVKFRSDVDGFIDGIRFYKAINNTGTHVANLWTLSGTLLATAIFSNETASGWQQVSFSSPVRINADTTYIASYFAPNAHYAFDTDFFARTGVDNQVLHALPNGTGVDGGDGVYAYGSTSSFPNLTYHATNYWVDVVFASDPNASTTPSITNLSPAAGLVGASVTITGTHFGSSQGASTVTFNGTAAIPTTWSATNIVVPVPTGATTGAVAVAVNGNVSNAATFTVTSSAACPCTIWSPGTVPTVADGGPDFPVELGVKFRSDVDGFITGIRFYKASSNTGTHVANLWSSAGTLLATTTFTNETGSGWQGVSFESPVAISAGTTYVASYFAPNGHYPYDRNYFTFSGVDNQVLHALMDGTLADGGNGVYAYGDTSSFPNVTHLAGNYWVDVVFNTVAQISAPAITSVTPTSGPVGTPVVISGSNFGTSQAAGSTVTFNGVPGFPTAWTENRITVPVPAGATTGSVLVTVNGLVSNGVNFTVTPPLTISAVANLLSNGAGWNNSPVTISFQCAGGIPPLTCPPPQTVSSEGTNQIVSGTVLDSSGNSATASTTLNLDFTAPSSTLGSPASNTTVTRPTLRVTGSVSDSLSGVAAVTCNGVLAASFDSAGYVCNVPLALGINPIQVQTTDNAGNANSSAQVFVTYAPVPPSALFISPSVLNMQIGETHSVALSGELGQSVSGAIWSAADPTVVSLSATDPPQLNALAAGTTTVNTSFSGLQATMTVNVFSDALPVGTPLWSAQSVSGTAINGITPANPISNGDPDIYMIDGQSTLRGFTADGQQLWSLQISTGSANNNAAAQVSLDASHQIATATASVPPMTRAALAFRANALYPLQQHILGQRKILERRLAQTPSSPQRAALSAAGSSVAPGSLPVGGAGPALLIQTVADNASNAINLVFSCLVSNCNTFTPAFVAVDNASQSQVWEHDLSDGPYESIDPIAIAPDNTIYAAGVFETGLPNSQGVAPTRSLVVAIDGGTGLPKFTIPVIPSHTTFTLVDENGNVLEADDQDEAALIGPLAVMPDGSVRMLIETVQSTETDVQTNGETFNNPCGPGSRQCATSISNHRALQLLTVQPEGSSSLQPVRNYDFDGSGCTPCTDPGASNFFLPGDVIPDGLGGVLAQWTENQEQNNDPVHRNLSAHMRHLDGSGGFTDFTFADLGLVPPNLAAYQGESLVLGENNTFFGVGLKLQEVDINSFGSIWTTPFLSPKSAVVLSSTSDGGLLAAELTAPLGNADALQIFDPVGIVSTFQLSQSISNISVVDATTLVALSDPNGEAIGLPSTLSFDGAVDWNHKRGNKTGQRSPNLPKLRIDKVIAFVDKDGFSQTENVPFAGIAAGQVEEVRITSNVTSSSPRILLSMETAPKTVGAATFADGTTETVITPTASHPTIVKIKGVTTSSTVDNIFLTAKVANVVILRHKFSVVSVSLDLQTSGDIATDNSAKAIYLQTTAPDQGMGSQNFTGLGAFATNNNSFSCEVGVQFVGTVSPANYRGKVVLRRTLLHFSLYDGPNNVLKDDGPPGEKPADDTSAEVGLDSDPQSGGSGGKVYDIDGPGPSNVFPSITIRRLRANLSEYAVLDSRNNPVPASGQLPWYARVSCKTDENDPRVISLINDVNGDNQGGQGTTPTSALLN